VKNIAAVKSTPADNPHPGNLYANHA